MQARTPQGFAAFTAFAVCLLASLAWWSCSSSSASGGGGGADAGEAGEEEVVATGDGPACDPCQQICACMQGDTFHSAAQCTTYTCPPTGVWGPLECTSHSMCADSSDDGVPTNDAPVDVSTEAASDARADAPEDAISETAEAASDASSDASAD